MGQPSTPRAPNLTKGQTILRWEFNLAKADCESQDTANFPSSAGKITFQTRKPEKGKRIIQTRKVSNEFVFSHTEAGMREVFWE